jgi:hypothetical protein
MLENVGPEKTGSERVDAIRYNPNGDGYVSFSNFKT